ncbi:MAG: 5'-nucleotidase C-terminal domain-containing protein [Bacteroidota bacterium]
MKNSLFLLLSLTLLAACQSYRPLTPTDDGQLTFQILQVNDVYEIAPLSNGRVGGMARVAQVRKELLAENSNTITVLAGDFLSPSVIGTLKKDGNRIAGAQMVDAMNATGIDLVTFGNHEFDISESRLQARLDESEFTWIGSNVVQQKENGRTAFQVNGQDVPEYWIQTFTDTDGTRVKVGFISATIASNPKDYVHYEDAFSEAKRLYELVAPQVDLVIGLTHLSLEEDKQLAKLLPEIPLLMGGHEHHNMKVPVGKAFVTKADANAKSAYIHRIHFDKGKIKIESELKMLDETVALEAETQAVVSKWTSIADDIFAAKGMDTKRIVAQLPKKIDATEQVVRHRPSTASHMIVKAMENAYPSADLALINTGSIRVDDVLQDQLSEYDIIRLLPFGGGIQMVEMKGRLLEKVIRAGLKNVGEGGYLAMDNVTVDAANELLIHNERIVAEKTYSVVLPDFLLLGLETGLGFLKSDHPDIVNIEKPNDGDRRQDIRLVVVDCLLESGVPYLEE